jgi:A/G-specific adenine glycosylase
MSLEDWFRKTHRPLPWRETYDPYHVWVSEVMLQQTQVDTVLPYYERFLARFPTVETLARSSETEVLGLWSGLGYYSRARNFRVAAQQVIDEHGGTLPRSHTALLALPGIGRYMAGAIMSIAFNEPYPIVDGNVRRVLSRVNGWKQVKEERIWEAADAVAHSGEPRIVNQAMMELGAVLCTPKAPQCPVCPWGKTCKAFRTGQQAEFPAPKKRPKTIRVDLHAVIDRNQRGILMREADGLWEFPSFPEPPAGSLEQIGSTRHSITHHRVHVQVYQGKLGRHPEYRRVRFDTVPITSLTRKIYEIFQHEATKNTKI